MIGTQVILAAYQSHLGRVGYYTIATIEKVYKNGNVVIKGEQWKPSHDKRTFHAVGRTAYGSFNRNYYAIYDDETKARVQEGEAIASRQRRLRAVQEKVANARDITEEALKEIEKALGL